MSQKTCTLGKYVLGRTLGQGVSCKVKLAKSKTGKSVAVKILNEDKEFKEMIEAEVQYLKKLHHENIVNFIEMSTDQLKKDGKPSKTVDYIVLELAQGGELFDFVANSGKFSDSISRTYFIQLMDALKYMHAGGVCHRDLKPENIMLDSNFQLKVADFGFAAPTCGRDQSGHLYTQLGTHSYMAPEIHLGKPYTGQSVDIFAAAIILFIMMTQRPPFQSSETKDPHYQLLAAGRADLFWQAHEQSLPADIFSSEFKDLFARMTALNPKQRPSAEEVLKHAWMVLPHASKSDIEKEFATRKQVVDDQIKKEQDARRQERATKTQHQPGKIKVKRGVEDEALQLDQDQFFELEESKLEVLPFDCNCQARQTQFFTTSMCTSIFRDLIRFLRNHNINDFYISKTQWKLRFVMKNVKITCLLLQVSMDKHCVEFTRQLGDQMTFFECYREMAQYLLLHNDTTH